MIPGFRTVALLMLAAGVCVGVFATSLLAGDPAPVAPRLDPSIEAQLEHYRRRYKLAPAGIDAVRHELVRFRRSLRQKRIDLQQLHQDEFDVIVEETGARIQDIVERSTGGASGGP